MKQRRFLCNVCGKAYGNEQNLYRHSQNHLVQRYYDCANCHQSLKLPNSAHSCGKKKNLKKTIVKKVGKKTITVRSTCKLCLVQVASISVHMYTNHLFEKFVFPKRSFKCKICNITIDKKTMVQSHLQTHLREGVFDCARCHSSGKGGFKDYHKCAVNNRSVLGRIICKICTLQTSDFSSHVYTHLNEHSFDCKNCFKSFMHVDTLTGQSCDSDSNVRINRNCLICNAPVHDHEKSHLVEKTTRCSKIFKCKICRKTCKEAGYVSHFLTHINEQDFECSSCYLSYYRKIALNGTFCEGISCRICKEPYSSYDHVHGHLIERVFVCKFHDTAVNCAERLDIETCTGTKKFKEFKFPDPAKRKESLLLSDTTQLISSVDGYDDITLYLECQYCRLHFDCTVMKKVHYDSCRLFYGTT